MTTEQSVPARVGDWARAHPRLLAAAVILTALALSGTAVILAATLFSQVPLAGDIDPTPTPIESERPSATPSSEPSTSDAPSPSAAPTVVEPTASPAPTLAFEAPGDLLPPGGQVVVAVDAVQLRSEPGLDGPVVGVARRGVEYFVILPGPVVVDGIDWYQLLALEGGFSAWAAAGDGADRFLELVPPACPETDPDVAVLSTMLEWDRLACFGDRPLTVEGTFACQGCGGTYVGDFVPMWLAYPITGNLLFSDLRTREHMELRIPPDAGLTAPEQGSVVRVSGHFSDPASTGCTISTFAGELAIEVDPRTAELYCRERFVVDSFEVIGTDPDYQEGGS